MKTRNRIKRIAKNVRKWAEELQNKNKFWDNHLSGMCGIASYELFKRLRRAKFKPTMCFSRGHAFVKCNGFIVDVTATQFCKADVNKSNTIGYNNCWKSIEIRPIAKTFPNPWFWQSILHTRSKKEIINEVKEWRSDEIHPELDRKSVV